MLETIDRWRGRRSPSMDVQRDRGWHATYLAVLAGLVIVWGWAPAHAQEPLDAPRGDDAATQQLSLEYLLEMTLSRNLKANQEGRAYRIVRDQFERVTNRRFQPKYTLSMNQRLEQQRNALAAPLGTAGVGVQSTARVRLPTGADIQWTVGTSRTLQSASGVTDKVTSLTLSQPLLKGAGVRLSDLVSDIAAREVHNARLQLERVALDSVTDVIRRYLDHEQSRTDLEVSISSLETARLVNRIQKELVAFGRVPQSLLLNSESDIASARLGVGQATNTLRLAERNLLKSAELLSRAGPQAPSLSFERLPSDFSVYDVDRRDLQALRQAAARFSPELEEARNSLVIQQHLVDLAEDEMRNALTLEISASRRLGDRLGSGRTSDVSISLVKTFEFDKSDKELNLARAKMGLQNQQDRLQEVLEQVDAAVIDAHQQYLFSVQQHELAQSALQIARSVLASDTDRLRLGRVSALDLTSSQQAVRVAQSQLNAARINTVRNALELYRQTGLLLTVHGLQDKVAQWVASFER